MATFIQMYPPRDGKQYDCQCSRCGSSMDYKHCEMCDGDGYDGHDCGEDCCMCLNPEDNVPCDTCGGKGGWYRCFSSPEWCQSHPLPGRENNSRNLPEWFEVNQRGDRPQKGE